METYLNGLGVENEKKKGVMQDDYIRFMRFAHWKISNQNSGIIGIITNNSYLDGIIHRAMRKKLLDDFDEIYVLNLHGNSRIKEECPGGSKDENVFNIQQGVAVALFVKNEKKKGLAKIKYADLRGLKKNKFDYLEKFDIKKTKWQEIKVSDPFYFFVPKNEAGKEKYNKFVSVTEIFDKYTSGVETKRDNLVIDFNKNTLKNRINTFIQSEGNEELVMDSFNLSKKSDLNVKKAQKILKNTNLDESIINYCYRPLDSRWLFYNDELVSRTRKPLMQNMQKDNIALNVTRILKLDHKFTHILVSDKPTDRILLSNTTSESSFIFPLYVDEQENNSNQQSLLSDGNKEINNQNIKIVDKLAKQYSNEIDSKEVFYYIYAILYSNEYRKKYNEFLKIDFPKIPFTSDYSLFQKLAKLGEELANLHLLKSKSLNKSAAKFKGTGSNDVKKRDYRKKKRNYLLTTISISRESKKKLGIITSAGIKFWTSG